MKKQKSCYSHIKTGIALLSGLMLFTGALLLPQGASAATISCSSGVSGCHFIPTVKDGTARNVPTGRFTGSHARHSGYSTSSAKRQYVYACTKCHPSGSYGNAHQTGFKNITGSSLPKSRYSAGAALNGRIPNTNTPTFGNCSNIYCHSSGRGGGLMGQVQYSSAKWGGTETCLGCHGGRASASGNPARSVGNFTLTTTHSQHLKYPAAKVNCQMCHAKTNQTDAWTLKSYTGVQHHINGVREVTFTDVAYGSYTSYKSTEAGSSANTKICSNVACHGGKSRSAWSATVQNVTNACTHCHGQPEAANVPTNNTNLKMYAPGWVNGAYTGTSTDQLNVTTDPRVGTHFVHLSTIYMKKIKCNECHYVPTSPFDASNNHMTGPRYSSQSLYFAQSSTAKIVIGVASGSTPAQLATFTGYTSGLGAKAATCSSVYCHGNRMKTGIAVGTAPKPSWNQDLTANPATATSCGRCHGFPPTTGTPTHPNDATCSTCHSHLASGASPTTFINKALHINGKVEASSGHAYSYGGSKHMPGGTGSIKAVNATPLSNCGCHSVTTGGTYPVSARGVATNLVCTTCHWNNPNFYTTGSIGCGDCHGTDALLGRPNGGLTFPNYSGSHTAHAAQSIACADCHNGYGTGNKTHGNYSGNKKTAFTNISVKFNTAKSGTAAKWNNGGGTRANTSCTTSTCHGQKSPAWGQAIPAPQCARCHGYQSLVTLNNYTQNSIAPGTGNIDTNRTTGITVRGGLHQEHLKRSSNLSRKVRCIECHVSTTNVNHASLDNMTTAAVTFSGVATALSHTTASVSRASGIINCSNTECHHGGSRADGTAAGQSGITTRAALAWNNSALIVNTTIADTCTGKCHNMPPGGAVSGDTHSGLTASGTYTTPTQVATACASCHAPLSASGTTLANLWANMNLHINGTVDAASKCVDCHLVAKGTRSAVVGEFNLTWGHKKSGRGAVTDDDCIVCHLEGDSTTKKINPTYHLGLAGGNIDLRDPDGTGEAAIAGLTFTKFAISYAAGSRTSAIGTTVDFKITQLFCLKCHDAGGATNTTARAGTSPNATNPFGTGKPVLNTAAQFAIANSSKHPILGPLTKDFPTPAKMVAPYNNFTRNGTGGAANKTAGVVLNCFDCHTTGTALTNRTIVSHGNAVTLRGTIDGASPTLCSACHTGYVYNTNDGHGTGSAFSSTGTQRMSAIQNICSNCHASGNAAVRPQRAEDVHGVNTLPAVVQARTARWLAGGANGVPIAFIRNTDNLGDHSPLKIGTTTFATGCDMGVCRGAGSNSPYSPGGTY